MSETTTQKIQRWVQEASKAVDRLVAEYDAVCRERDEARAKALRDVRAMAEGLADRGPQTARVVTAIVDWIDTELQRLAPKEVTT